MPAASINLGQGHQLLGAPLADAEQDPGEVVTDMLAVVADIPKRLDPGHDDTTAALTAWSSGLTALAGEVADADAEAYVALALAALPAGADEDDYAALVQQVVDATEGIDAEMAVELRAIADVLDPQ